MIKARGVTEAPAFVIGLLVAATVMRFERNFRQVSFFLVRNEASSIGIPEEKLAMAAFLILRKP